MEKEKGGVLIVSLDFELFWGVQDVRTFEKYGNNISGGREAIPRLLKLFGEYGIHATWATVGFMFADGKEDLKKYIPDVKPTYENAIRSTYNCIENVSDSEKTSSEYLAPSLIKLISETEGQEIGSHTFSHYYCLEKGQTAEQFEADMGAALRIAEDKGYKLTSVVLPRNQCSEEYIRILQKLGFTSYRDEENDWIHEKIKPVALKRALRLADVYLPLTGQGGYVPRVENGIVNLTGSRMYKPYFKGLAFLEKLKVHRIKRQMLHAAERGLAFHFWWHPHNVGIMTDFHINQLREIFEYYDYLREKYGMRSLNMREYSEEIL